jgi:hypothetical protein
MTYFLEFDWKAGNRPVCVSGFVTTGNRQYVQVDDGITKGGIEVHAKSDRVDKHFEGHDQVLPRECFQRCPCLLALGMYRPVLRLKADSVGFPS